MERATRWLRGFLGMKKDRENAVDSVSPAPGDKREKKRWSFSKPSKECSSHPPFAYAPPNAPARHSGAGDSPWLGSCAVDAGKEKEQQQQQQQKSRHANAITVAAATAAAADAAVAAAEAAMAVARLTAGHWRGLLPGCGKEAFAAMKIQCVFRGFLARKALKALRGIVKLQALVRGYLVRKRAATTLRRMQSLIRAQGTVRSQIARLSVGKENRSPMDNSPRRSTDRCHDESRSEFHSKRLPGSFDVPVDDSPRVVEVDSVKLGCRSRRIGMSPLSESREQIPYPSPISCQVQRGVSTPDQGQQPDLRWCLVGKDYERGLDSAGNVPPPGLPTTVRANRAPAAPVVRRSERGFVGEGGLFHPYSGVVPSYMANTKSSRAKARSQSAPRQRPEEGGAKKGLSLSEIMASRKSISSVKMDRSFSRLEEIFE